MTSPSNISSSSRCDDIGSPAGSAAQDKDTATFTQFNQLPAELRIKIWDMARPSQIVTLRCERYRPRPKINFWKEKHTTSTKPLALLSVNHESRALTLPYYDIIKSKIDDKEGLPLCYVDHEQDTLYLREEGDERFTVSHTCKLGSVKQVRSLAISIHSLSEFTPDFIYHRTNVKQIWLVGSSLWPHGKDIGVVVLLPRPKSAFKYEHPIPTYEVFVRRLERWKRSYPVRPYWELPEVCLVTRDYWEKEGSRLVESAEGLFKDVPATTRVMVFSEAALS